MTNPFESARKSFEIPGTGRTGSFYSLPALEASGLSGISRLPVSIRIVLESLLRNCDGQRVKEEDVRRLAAWKPNGERENEIPFVVARIVLQDFTGVPLLVDLAAMRSAVGRLNRDPKLIEPLVPVALVVDHSVQVDYWSTPDALRQNMEIEFQRNNARYQFLKWGMQAFDGFEVVPPGIGIVHQVNLEYLARGVLEKDGVFYPDSLVGTDSHTTMINGLGIVAWGVGGIEAEAGMLGQPVYFLTPDVVGVHMTGRIRPGVTATDIALTVTEMLRKAKVVGKFVEYHGEGASSLPLTDRATIANMAPEYGATMGYFGVDAESVEYLRSTGRTPEQCAAFEAYFRAQGMFGIPKQGECDYSQLLELDLDTVRPSLAGPKRPQDRIELGEMGAKFRELLTKPVKDGGYGIAAEAVGARYRTTINAPHDAPVLVGGGLQETNGGVSLAAAAKNTSAQSEAEMVNNRPSPDRVEDPTAALPESNVTLRHGDVLIAAITSCTNTSNPSVMLAAGLLAKKAVEKGLRVAPQVKASLAPGSRVVTEYLRKTGLDVPLDRLGFHTVGYGCTTCIGNSGPLDPRIEEVVTGNDLVAAAVLSGNRNFEARVHASIKANYLASPPLVVAFALAGRVDFDAEKDPIGRARDGAPVHLRDIWPSPAEIEDALVRSVDPETYRSLYANLAETNPLWMEIPAPVGKVYEWDRQSTYIQEPAFFDGFALTPGARQPLDGARALAIFGDSVTTDHISPAGSIKKTSPAGLFLQEQGVAPEDFNSYGSRRGNDRVMTRGTFANVRIRNLMVPGTEGGVTRHQPDGAEMAIFDAATKYASENVPLVILAGSEYGTGSSRDWAAKGTRLLGVRAVVAQSFERIHRANLVGMGVVPFAFEDGVSAASLGLDGTESYAIPGLDGELRPRQMMTMKVTKKDGECLDVPVRLRIDTGIEVEYFRHGGILPYVLRQLLREAV